MNIDGCSNDRNYKWVTMDEDDDNPSTADCCSVEMTLEDLERAESILKKYSKPEVTPIIHIGGRFACWLQPVTHPPSYPSV